MNKKTWIWIVVIVIVVVCCLCVVVPTAYMAFVGNSIGEIVVFGYPAGSGPYMNTLLPGSPEAIEFATLDDASSYFENTYEPSQRFAFRCKMPESPNLVKYVSDLDSLQGTCSQGFFLVLKADLP